MSKQTILGLEKTLCDLGYNSNHINSFIGTIDQILQKGSATVSRWKWEPQFVNISAAGVRPLFKINPKSVDVYLITTGELNVLRIHHPSNTWVFNNSFRSHQEYGCYCGNQKWLATRCFGDEGLKRGPDKGFIF